MRFAIALFLVCSPLFAKLDSVKGILPHDPSVPSDKHAMLPTGIEAFFPCESDLKKGGPKIILTVESKSSTSPSAREQVCMVGAEGVYCGDASAHAGLKELFRLPLSSKGIRAVEDPFPAGLTILLRHYLALQVSDTPKTRTDLITTIQQPYLKESWGRVRKSKNPFEDAEQEKIAKVIDATINSTADEAKAHEASIPNSPWHKNPEALRNILRAWATEYAVMASSGQYQIEKSTPPNLKEAVRKLLDGEDLAGLPLVHETWRNTYLAKNIARLYCQYMMNKKDLHLILSRKPSPALKDLLFAESKGNVEVVELDASVEASNLMRELQAKKDRPR